MYLPAKTIKVGSRASRLARRQVDEVYRELISMHPHIVFAPIFVATQGDRDRTTSLRTLGQTDFFTKEIDQMVLQGKCRIAIHSAKDLANPLAEGLKVIALTKGVDASDSLVLRTTDTVSSLPSGAKIATSSQRREENVKLLRKDLEFVDIRGLIEERLEQLFSGLVDGVVIAEAALIRLGLTDLNRIKLPGEVALLQGRLAVVAKQEDDEMQQLFKSLNRL